MKKSKKIILPVIAAVSLALSSFALADTTTSNGGNNNIPSGGTNTPSFNSSGIVKAINHFSNRMFSLAMAGATSVYNSMYQFDQNLSNTLKANAASKTVTSQVTENAGIATASYINNSFQVLPNQILSTSDGMIGAQKINADLNKQNSLASSLTTQVPASDTLYSNNPQVIEAQYTNGSNYYIGPPKKNDDSYFSVSSVLAPMAYTPAQQTAAKDYMAYLTKSYDNPANAIDLSSLQTTLSGMKPAKQYKMLHNIVSGQSELGAAYQTYQLALRSNMASKSIAVNNFNHLIAERSPNKKEVSGIYDSRGKEIKYPSPLQVESYLANHRINNPAWIKSLQSQSSTTLQRETVVLLALLAHQNYQAHLDSERILTALSATELQGSSNDQMILSTKATRLNGLIKSLGKNQATQSQPSVSNAKSAAEMAKEMSIKNHPGGK